MSAQRPQRTGERARRLVVLTTPELAPGYRLAGVATVEAGSAGEAGRILQGLVEEAGERGIVAVHEPYFEALDERLRRRLERSTAPLVVALPAGEAEAREGERRARLMRTLFQAVGYEITFEPGGRQS